MMNNIPTYYAAVRPELKRFIPGGHARVLEIGCGKGGFRSHLDLGAEVWGVEPVAAVAEEARSVLHRVLVGTYESVRNELPDRYFDLVICNDVIEHMPNDRQFLIDIRAKMTKSSYLMGSIPNMRHWPVLKDLLFRKQWNYQDCGVLDRTHLRFYTENSFPELLNECGFDVETFEGINASIDPRTNWLLKFIAPRLFSDVEFIQFAFRAQPRP